MRSNHEANGERMQELRTKKQKQNPPGQKGSEDEKLGTSWVSAISGWFVALGVTLGLGGMLFADGSIGNEPQSEIAWFLATLNASFLTGGYVAGRMAGFYGLKHGLLVALLSLVVTAVLGLVWLAIGGGLSESLNGLTLPKRPGAWQTLGTLLSPSGILALILPFISGAIGGAWGEKTV